MGAWAFDIADANAASRRRASSRIATCRTCRCERRICFASRHPTFGGTFGGMHVAITFGGDGRHPLRCRTRWPHSEQSGWSSRTLAARARRGGLFCFVLEFVVRWGIGLVPSAPPASAGFATSLGAEPCGLILPGASLVHGIKQKWCGQDWDLDEVPCLLLRVRRGC